LPLRKARKIEKETIMAYIINKGIRARIIVKVSQLVVGKDYTCVLYKKAKDEDNRITAIATAQEGDEKPYCVFVFEPEQTDSMKAGDAILEVYDHETLEQMYYKDNFCTFRATSLSS
jgi:ABC-type uncharacterized transport system substrate-binding protein